MPLVIIFLATLMNCDLNMYSHRQMLHTYFKKKLHQFAKASRLRITFHLEQTGRVFFSNFEVTIAHEMI